MLIASLSLCVFVSCTNPSKREPAAVCDLDSVSALKSAAQLHEIFKYLRGPFSQRVLEFANSPSSCETNHKADLYGADISYAQNYVRNFLGQSQATGLVVLDSRLVEELKCLKPVAEEVRPFFEKVKEDALRLSTELADLKAKYSDLSDSKTKANCPAQTWPMKIRVAKSVMPHTESANGTSFVASAGRKKFLVTAAHVSREGLVNAGLDSSITPSSEKRPPLTVVKSGQLPGTQKFYAVGYPEKDSGQLAAIECQFEGFVKGARGLDAQYLFYCPGRGSVKWISGGPLVDEVGRVWGINSQQSPFSGAFFVTPLSVEKGELRVGVQNTFLSDVCFERNLLAPYRCQVMPQMFEEQIP